MADFYLILNRTISALPENTGRARRSVYERARNALIRQLEALDPPLPPEELTRQRLQLEEAIRKVEAEHGTAMFSGRPVPTAKPKPSEPEETEAAASGESAVSQDTSQSDAWIDPEAQIEQAKTILKDAVRDAGQLGHRTMAKPVTPLSETAPSPLGRDQSRPSQNDGPTLAATDAERLATSLSEGEPARGNRRSGLVLVLIILLVLGAGGGAAYFQKDAIFEALLGAREDPSTVLADADDPEPVAEDQASDQKPPRTVRRVDERVPVDDQTSGQDQSGTTALQSDDATTTITRQPSDNDQAEISEPESAGQQTAQTSDNDDPEPAVVTPSSSDEDNAAPSSSASTPLISNRAILYEEGDQPGQTDQALTATVAWRLMPGSGAAGPTIQARVSVPDRGLTLDMTIRKNDDQALPASHMVELTFASPADFPGGAIERVPGIIMKTAEQARGRALSAAAAKVSDNFFWLALSSIPGDQQVNQDLLRTQSWIDIPLLYTNKRRAILTLEKGDAGRQVFDQALEAWGDG